MNNVIDKNIIPLLSVALKGSYSVLKVVQRHSPSAVPPGMLLLVPPDSKFPKVLPYSQFPQVPTIFLQFQFPPLNINFHVFF